MMAGAISSEPLPRINEAEATFVADQCRTDPEDQSGATRTGTSCQKEGADNAAQSTVTGALCTKRPEDEPVASPVQDGRQNSNSHTNETMEKVNQSEGSGSFKRERLLVVANRLPMTILADPCGPEPYQYAMSSGGLVSGLKGIKGIDFLWIGWPGNEIPQRDEKLIIQECAKMHCRPVFLDRLTIDLFYNGFCNNILWPLIHYIPPPMEVGCHDTKGAQWEAYCRANLLFVKAILDVYEENDIVWVHDYHLMLVPQFLRQAKPSARIGWFLHTPFPSQEMFRMLPYRTEILTGLLSANFIGFHVYDYLRHFISSCVQLLGLESSAQGIDARPVGGVFVNCGAVPLGIEPDSFLKKLADPAVTEAIHNLRNKFGGKKVKVILGVDRLDYMKGLPHKLNAFDRFLELHPEWIEKCVLVQLAVPSRTLVPEYQRLKSTVHELVGMINGKRGSLTHVPVHYLDQSLSFDELVALYRVADVAFISSIRDGMNLVAYEYIACQADNYGVLILSEFAGAAQSLRAGSLRVNPWNLDEAAESIHKALTMSKAERRSIYSYALNHVKIHTSGKWAEIFVELCREASEKNEEVRAAVPPMLSTRPFFESFVNAKERLIVVDLLDALIPARGSRGMPMKKFKKLIQLPAPVLSALDRLGRDPLTTVIVLTPHPKSTLERVLGDVHVCLAPEKGCLYRDRQGQWVRFVEEKTSSSLHSATSFASMGHEGARAGTPASATGGSPDPQRTPGTVARQPSPENPGSTPSVVAVANDWMPGVEKVLRFFERRTPGSYTEKTTGTLTWFWDDTLPDFGKQQSRDLLVHLWTGPLSVSADVEVMVGSRFIEIRSPQCGRSKLLQRIIQYEFASRGKELDWAVCVGNFPSREEDIHALFEERSPPFRGASGSSFSSENYFTGGTSPLELRSGQANAMKREDLSMRESTELLAETEPTGMPSLMYYSISVGPHVSRAQFCLPSAHKVQALIQQMALCLEHGLDELPSSVDVLAAEMYAPSSPGKDPAASGVAVPRPAESTRLVRPPSISRDNVLGLLKASTTDGQVGSRPEPETNRPPTAHVRSGKHRLKQSDETPMAVELATSGFSHFAGPSIPNYSIGHPDYGSHQRAELDSTFYGRGSRGGERPTTAPVSLHGSGFQWPPIGSGSSSYGNPYEPLIGGAGFQATDRPIGQPVAQDRLDSARRAVVPQTHDARTAGFDQPGLLQTSIVPQRPSRQTTLPSPQRRRTYHQGSAIEGSTVEAPTFTGFQRPPRPAQAPTSAAATPVFSFAGSIAGDWEGQQSLYNAGAFQATEPGPISQTFWGMDGVEVVQPARSGGVYPITSQGAFLKSSPQTSEKLWYLKQEQQHMSMLQEQHRRRMLEREQRNRLSRFQSAPQAFDAQFSQAPWHWDEGELSHPLQRRPGRIAYSRSPDTLRQSPITEPGMVQSGSQIFRQPILDTRSAHLSREDKGLGDNKAIGGEPVFLWPQQVHGGSQPLPVVHRDTTPPRVRQGGEGLHGHIGPAGCEATTVTGQPIGSHRPGQASTGTAPMVGSPGLVPLIPSPMPQQSAGYTAVFRSPFEAPLLTVSANGQRESRPVDMFTSAAPYGAGDRQAAGGPIVTDGMSAESAYVVGAPTSATFQGQ